MYFCEATTNIVRQDRSAKIVGTPVVSVKIGDHCYYGLCDIGASASVIPYTIYQEIKREIGPCELEEVDLEIKLASKDVIHPIGIVKDVQVLCGKVKYPADFLIWGQLKINFVLSYSVDVVSWITDTGSKGYPLFRFGMGREGG